MPKLRSNFSPMILLLLLLCAVDKRMVPKIDPHRARSVTYAILRNYEKKTAEKKKKFKKIGDKR